MAARKIALVGSTGSIGCSTLEVIAANRERFEVECLIAGRQGAVLAEQVRTWRPRIAAVSDATGFSELCSALGVSRERAKWENTELLCGEAAIRDAIKGSSADVVVAAVVGMAGLSGVLAAIDAGRTVALANKEALVVGGELVMRLARERGVQILPVDSEHSAIFQVLQGTQRKDLDTLILTASGGPFLHTPQREFSSITPTQALKHPKWNMGAKISIDSATMMNKALEVIEARWLFDVSPDSIEVIIHPQSIIHSMIRLVDGTVLAQLSHPDMKGPIAYALTYPGPRLDGVMKPLDFASLKELTFLPLDSDKFPGINRAIASLKGANGAPAVLNTANEVGVAKFLRGSLPFESIHALIGEALEKFGGRTYSSAEELFALTEEVAEWSRHFTTSI